MKQGIFIVFILLYSIKFYACCAEYDYRLLPIGEIDKEVLFVEFNVSRNCKQGKDRQKSYWINGTVNLVKKGKDSLLVVENIDTFQIRECICDSKNYYSITEYEDIIEKYYIRALTKAKGNKNFTITIPALITFNDTLHTERVLYRSDSIVLNYLKYKDLLKVDFEEMEILSCFPDKVSEVRTYETKNYNVMVIRLRCNFIKDDSIKHIRSRFKNIETAFWKEQVQWHGIAKDYYIVENKNHY